MSKQTVNKALLDTDLTSNEHLAIQAMNDIIYVFGAVRAREMASKIIRDEVINDYNQGQIKLQQAKMIADKNKK